LKTTFCLIQDKYNCIYLGLSQAKTQFACTACTIQANYRKSVFLYSMHCTNKLLETSLCVQCVLYRQTAPPHGKLEAASPPRLDLSPGGPGRGQLTASPATRWERALTRVCLPFPSTGFPGLGWPREGTPPREGQCCCGRSPSKTGNSN
jgi:hypothetical protein